MPFNFKSNFKSKEVGNTNYCFIACPTSEHLVYIESWKLHIKDVLKKYKFDIKVIPIEIKPEESIFKTITELVMKAALGIVILDSLRPNVVFEYGLLRGFEKPTIVLIEEGAQINVKNLYLEKTKKVESAFRQLDNPPLDIDKHFSDVRDLKHIPYNQKHPEEFMNNLKEAIEKIKPEISCEMEKMLTPKGMEKQNNDVIDNFSILINELIRSHFKTKKPNEKSVIKLVKKIDKLSKKHNLKFPISYYKTIGEIYFELEKYDKAIKFYDKVIKIDKNDVSSWVSKGVALFNLGSYSKSLKIINKSLEMNPDTAVALCVKASILHSRGKDNDAFITINKIKEKDCLKCSDYKSTKTKIVDELNKKKKSTKK